MPNTPYSDYTLFETKADLCREIFRLQCRWILQNGFKYSVISDARAAAIDASEEVQWRFMQTRERQAIAKNGLLPEEQEIQDKYGISY